MAHVIAKFVDSLAVCSELSYSLIAVIAKVMDSPGAVCSELSYSLNSSRTIPMEKWRCGGENFGSIHIFTYVQNPAPQ